MSDGGDHGDAGPVDAGGPQDASSSELADTGPGPLDCDGAPTATWWRDADGDGFGAAGQVAQACLRPTGYVPNADDCDDGDALRHPSAAELCDTRDNDCDVATADACPDQCAARTFAGRLYWFCGTPSSWGDAALACEAGNLSLVRIDSAAENDFVRAGANEIAQGLNVWLGGSDAAEEGVWRWSDGDVFWLGGASGSAASGAYSKWGTDQPSESVGEHCAELRGGNLWNDASCTELRAFVCEGSVSPSS